MTRGRKPSIGYRKRGGGGYFFTKGGKPIALAMGPDDGPTGPTYLAAFDEWRKHVRQDEGKGSDGYALSALFNGYRAFLEGQGRTATLANVNNMLKGFAEKFGKMPVGTLKPFHVRQWLDGATTWGENTKRLAYKLLSTAMNWGVMEGVIASNPIKGRMKAPKEKVKGKEAKMTPQLCDLLIRHAGEDFAAYLRMLRLSGARPEEIAVAEARHLNGWAIVYPWNVGDGEFKHKQAQRGRKVDRVIHLTPDMLAVCREQARKHPRGPLFPTKRGKPWTNQNRNDSFSKLLDVAEVREYLDANGIDPMTVVPYSFRHSWISEWVESGRSTQVAADLVGTSIAMIEKYYSRPDADKMGAMYRDFMSHHKSI